MSAQAAERRQINMVMLKKQSEWPAIRAAPTASDAMTNMLMRSFAALYVTAAALALIMG